MYLLTNDEESKLGTTPLPNGVVRVFRDNGSRRAQLPGRPADQVRAHRRQDRAEPGRPDPEVIFELVKLRVWRDNILDAHPRAPTSTAGSTTATVQDRRQQHVAGWDDHTIFRPADPQLHEDKPIEVEVRRSFGRTRRLPEQLGGQEPRLPHGRILRRRFRRRAPSTCCTRSSIHQGRNKQARQRDHRGGRIEP